MVWSYFNNPKQGQTETAHGTLRRGAEKSRRRTHLVRLCCSVRNGSEEISPQRRHPGCLTVFFASNKAVC